jgi:hypothetical protein
MELDEGILTQIEDLGVKIGIGKRHRPRCSGANHGSTDQKQRTAHPDDFVTL